LTNILENPQELHNGVKKKGGGGGAVAFVSPRENGAGTQVRKVREKGGKTNNARQRGGV